MVVGDILAESIWQVIGGYDAVTGLDLTWHKLELLHVK